jgi:YgiT-type zinc finger domain-containing protein
MMCLICRQAETIDGLTSVNFERGEMRLLIRNVPAHVCPDCREAYLNEEVAVRLLQETDKLSKAGLLEHVIEYNSII